MRISSDSKKESVNTDPATADSRLHDDDNSRHELTAKDVLIHLIL